MSLFLQHCFMFLHWCAVFFQGCIVLMGLFIIYISVKNRKVPKGVVDWIFILGMIDIFLVWIHK